MKLIKAGGGVELRWKVSVCNAKHFTALTASGAPPALATRTRLEASADISSRPPRAHKDLKVVKGPGRPKDILLGAVTVDGDGNLILVGARGQCFSDGEPLILGDGALFQAKWFDDVCDGRVECEVFEGGVSTGKALPAWIVTGKPASPRACHISSRCTTSPG